MDARSDTQKRPIVVCFPFVGDSVGGSHISALKLIQGLDTARVRPIVALHDCNGKLAAFLREHGQAFVQAPLIKALLPPGPHGPSLASRLWNNVAAPLPQLRAFIRTHGIDIVHTNDGRIHGVWALPTRLSGAKLLWHHRAPPDSKGVNLLAPLLADQIVTVSRFASPERPVRPVEHKVSVVHSPFDHPASLPDRAAARQMLLGELDCAPQTRFVGYFGSLIDRKRPVLFVDIIAAYMRQNPDLPIIGVLFGESASGGPKLEDAVSRRAKELGVEPHVRLMGFRHPIEPWIAAVDILLVPAVNEPFGRTLIEAMLLGTPVIATDHGGNPEAIQDGENGILVEAENPQAFVEPIRRLLGDLACWTRISDTARREALVNYGIAIHADRIMAIYDRLMASQDAKAIRAAS